MVQDSAGNNFGNDKDLKVKPDAGRERRILVAFNLAAIPSTSAVLNATLRLYQDNKKDNQTVSLHRLTNSWSEFQVSWNNRSSGVAWATRGGDFAGTALLTFTPNVDKVYRDLDVTGVTQSWVNGGLPNYGFLLRSTGNNGEVKFKSREEANASKQPQLCINYR